MADLCEAAIDAGLSKESKTQATELWSSVLMANAMQLKREIAPSGQLTSSQLNRRWRIFRSRAVSRLDKALELKPDNVDALILLAEFHSLAGGDKEAAMKSIEKAIASLTDDKEKLSTALYIRSRLAEDDDMRIADLSQAVKINPKNFEALMDRALYRLENDETEDAMEDFRSVLKVEDDNTDRFQLISQVLFGRRLFKQAVQILNLAIEADPENADLYFSRARGHLAEENNKAALKDLDKTIELDRTNVAALSMRARVNLVAEDYDKALVDANEIIQQSPDSPAGLELRSLVYRSQNKLDKAIADVESLLEMTSGNLDYKFDLAILYNANDQPSKAIPVYDEIIRRLPDVAQGQILRSRGDAYLSLGKHQRAIDDYELAIELIEENTDSEFNGIPEGSEAEIKAGLLNNLSWVLSTSPDDEIRDGKKAVELATEAAELTEYKAAYILSTLAAGYAETGDFKTARKWATQAVEKSESDEQREGLQDELDFYKEDKPWREQEDVENEKKDGDDDSGKAKDKEKDDEDSDDEDSDEGRRRRRGRRRRGRGRRRRRRRRRQVNTGVQDCNLAVQI